MKKMLTRSVLFAALTLSPMALAQNAAPSATPPAAPTATPVAKPSADAVRDTVNYFYKGQGQGPVLIDAKLCTDVPATGANTFECVGEMDPAAGVKANSSVKVWQAYLVPQNDVIDDLAVQVKQGNTVRETKDIKIKEGFRSRVWSSVKLNKPGAWTITIMRGDQVLKEIPVKVL